MIDPFLRKISLPILLLLLTIATNGAWAQIGRPMPGAPVGNTPPGTASTGAGDKVDLIHADSLYGVNQPGAVVRRLIRNVKLQQKGVVLYCDLAIQNTTTNVIEAYGNVRMVQGDTINVRGDTLYYYGNTRQANVLGNVVLKDRKMTLSTARLDYDMLTGVAHYPVKGRIIDRENTLTSDEGYYDTRSKVFTFQHNVRLLNQPPGKEKTTILADSLLYNSLSKIADFQGPTRIISKDGTLVARNGQYNTTTRVSNFRQRATAETDKYTLTGDTLNFDNVAEVGVAHGNVVIVNKADKTTLTGDHGRYNGKAGVSRMIGHAVVRSPISQGANLDTLYMRADTLFSFDNKVSKKKKLVGHRNVLVFKSDLQSRCDSLVYDVNDSLLYFYKKPIVWSQNYQMEADSMTARLKNNRINTMFLKSRSFVISQDTLRNFNQVKGRQITAFFRTILAPVAKTGRPNGPITASATNRPTLSPVTTTTTTAEKTTLDRVLVEGNGQTIYFAVDEKNRMVGMNRTECSKMNIEFTDSRVTRIRNYGRPDMFLTPPKELTDEKKRLDGFRWRETDKPTKLQVLGLTPLNSPKPAAPTNLVAMGMDKLGSEATDAAKFVTQQLTSNPALTKAAPIVGQLLTAKPTGSVLPRSVAVTNQPVAAKLPFAQPVTTALRPPVGNQSTVATSVGAASTKPVNPATLVATKAIPTAPATEPLARKPLLDKPVSLRSVRPAKPLTVSTTLPAVLIKSAVPKSDVINAPVADKAAEPVVPPVDKTTDDVVQPVMTESVAEKTVVPLLVIPVIDRPVLAKPVLEKPRVRIVAQSVNSAAPSRLIEPVVVEPLNKPVGDKADESTQPVAVSSSRNTLPTRRAEKQQKAAGPLIPKNKLKLAPTPPVTDESALEQELNRKSKKQ